MPDSVEMNRSPACSSRWKRVARASFIWPNPRQGKIAAQKFTTKSTASKARTLPVSRDRVRGAATSPRAAIGPRSKSRSSGGTVTMWYSGDPGWNHELRKSLYATTHTTHPMNGTRRR
jgi:hypothetical protein